MRVNVLIGVDAEKLFSGGIKNLTDRDFTVVIVYLVKIMKLFGYLNIILRKWGIK